LSKGYEVHGIIAYRAGSIIFTKTLISKVRGIFAVDTNG